MKSITKPQSERMQLIYAVFVITLIPLAIAFNTLFLIRNIQQDMDFELNNKALIVETLVAENVAPDIEDPLVLQEKLERVTTIISEIKALEFFRVEENNPTSFATTSDLTKSVTDPRLNQLALADSGHAFSKQIYTSVNQGPSERLWLVASAVKNTDNKIVGVMNLYISAAQIDSITNRTITQSIVILIATIIIVILALLNHFRFFEQSLLFKKLQEVDNLKDEFISIASHELKTPLTVINNYAYMLLKNPIVAANETLRQEADRIAVSSKRLATLVADILDVSRIEQGRMKLNIQTHDLRTIITDVLTELYPQAQEKQLMLYYTPPQQPLPVMCDKDKMHQIMLNVIGNSVKYTLKGSVTVTHEMQNNKIRTFVRDTGVGISAEGLRKLFGKFSRIQTEETKNISGTGLGLWLTKQLVEKMGGTIDAQSIEHQGSQFEITFPLAKQ